MEASALPSRILRVDSRYRHWAQDLPRRREAVPGREAEEKERVRREDASEPLLIREEKGRAVMGSAHRMFHRRAAQAASNILTVNVEVVATLDGSGNVVGQETVTASIPGVPAMPTAPLPSVPSVPAFPSDLTVPAYPWPSGVPSATAQAASTTSLLSAATTASTPVDSTAILPTAFPSASGGYNSTTHSIISSSTFSSSRNSSSTSSTSSSTRASTSSTRTSSTSVISSASSPAADAASTALGGGGGGNPANTGSPPAATSSAAANSSKSDSSGPLGTPQVVGTVFGSLAGAALLLALILFLLRRHKQKQRSGAMQLTGDDQTDNQPMTQPAARGSFVTPSFLNRFSGASRSTAETSTGERGFQRISGRKLPSAFSEGMTSEQVARGEGTLSGSSFYQDDKGVYGGPVVPKDFGKETGTGSESGTVGVKERVMPSPARTPVIHHPEDAPPFGTSRNGGGSALSPPHTPNNPEFPPRGTLGRSHPSHDGSRSSRFTENV